MNDHEDKKNESELKFFGKISAAAGHELKNTLAIINENAGLLEDMVLMMGQGVSLNPERLTRLSTTIGKQVKRADRILKDMSRFSHCIDGAQDTVDIKAMLALLVSLSSRDFAMQGIEVEAEITKDPTWMIINPFWFLNLVWCCLEFAASEWEGVKNMRLFTENTKDRVMIKITCEGLGGNQVIELFPTEEITKLQRELNAHVNIAKECDEIVISLLK